MKILENLLAHIDKCPLGWIDDKVMMLRSTTEADILAWAQKLKLLRDELTPCRACEKPVGSDAQAQSLGFCSGSCARSHDRIWWCVNHCFATNGGKVECVNCGELG